MKNILAKINALSPNPGSWFEVNGSRIKPIKAIEVNFNGNPGEVLNNDFTFSTINKNYNSDNSFIELVSIISDMSNQIGILIGREPWYWYSNIYLNNILLARGITKLNQINSTQKNVYIGIFLANKVLLN